jgi:hypothetical protein
MPIIKFRQGQEISSSKLNEIVTVINNLEIELKKTEGYNETIATEINSFRTKLDAFTGQLDEVADHIPSMESLLQSFVSLKDQLKNVLSWTDGPSIVTPANFVTLEELIEAITEENATETDISDAFSSYLSNVTDNLLIFRGNTAEINAKGFIDKQILFNTENQTISVDGYYNGSTNLSRKLFGLAASIGSLITIGTFEGKSYWYIDGERTTFEARGPQGPQGLAGTNGVNGANGFSMLSGNTIPNDNNFGIDNDLYMFFPTEANQPPTIYKKINGVWRPQRTIVGLKGDTGTPGSKVILDIKYSTEEPALNQTYDNALPATRFVGIRKYYENEQSSLPPYQWIRIRGDIYYPSIENGVLTWVTDVNDSNFEDSFDVIGPNGLPATFDTNLISIETVDNSTEAEVVVYPTNLIENKYGITIKIPRGLTGPAGPEGASFNFKGRFATTAELPNSGQVIGDAYLIGDGVLWVYTGSTEPEAINGFVFGADIRGAKGEKGDVGATGPQGQIGPKGDKGDTGIGLQGPRGVSIFYVINDNAFPTDLTNFIPGDMFISQATGNTRYVFDNAGTKQLLTGTRLVHGDEVSTTGTANKILRADVNGNLDANILKNAATATKLQGTVTINNVNFDGSAGITIPTYRTITLTIPTSTGTGNNLWNTSNNQITISPASGVTATNDIIVVPSTVSENNYQLFGLRAITQNTGVLTFEALSIPTSSLTVFVLIREG